MQTIWLLFCLIPIVRSQDSLNFMVLGDWGGLPTFPYRTPIERAVGRSMGKVADVINSSFTLALGDNFYFDGVKDIHDPRFNETYTSVFTAKSLQNPWYFVAGNHDHNGNVQAQIDYSKVEPRWNYPDFYYKLSFTSPSKQTLDIIMIDTVILCGNSDDDLLHLLPGGPEDVDIAEQQWQWIETQLKSSKADYLLVAGHYPVYSIAEHGPTPELVQRLKPMLYKYNVTAYICGHEHNIQHLEHSENNRTVQYFVSGAANFIDTSVFHKDSVPSDALRFHWADDLSLGAFSFIKVHSNKMEFVFITSGGKELYKKSMSPRL